MIPQISLDEVSVQWEWNEVAKEASKEWAAQRIKQEPPQHIEIPPFEDISFEARILSWGTTTPDQTEVRVKTAVEEGHDAERWDGAVNENPARFVRVKSPDEVILEALVRPVEMRT